MASQQNKQAETSQKKAQTSYQRMTLFIQQVEKEAQERLKGLEAKVENGLTTVDKASKVELMKLPPSLRNAKIGGLMSEEDVSSSDVSIALKNESLLAPQSFGRGPSRRVKLMVLPDSSMPPERPSAKTSKARRVTEMAQTLAGSSSAGNLRSSSITIKRSQSRTAKSKPRLRSVASAGDLYCSTGASAAHITVTTAQGKALSFSEETKHDINLDLLDDVAWCQIQKLRSLMEHLSRKSRNQR